MDRSHGGRVSHEADIERTAGDAMGDLMAEAALPGVFASGKTVVETASWRDHNGMNIMLKFSDGTSMTFSGTFTVEATGADLPSSTEEELKQAGRELMSGEEER